MLDAYVLHRIPYRETSLIIKFFTKAHGIVYLIAKGAKRKKHKTNAILQPFVPLLINWKQHYYKDLAILYNAETIATPHKLSRICLFGGLYINELLLKLLAIMEPHPELYDFYTKCLKNLENINDQTDLEKNLRFMEKKIIKAIGYGLELDRESQTNIAINLNQQYYFNPEHGLQNCVHSTIIPQTTINGASLLALHNDCYINDTQRKEAKLFIRQILATLLGKNIIHAKKLFY